jgi:hypothetical protein
MPPFGAAGRRRPVGNRVISLMFQFLEERGRNSGGGLFGVVREHDATRLGRSTAPMTRCSSRSGVIGFQSLARRSAPNTTMRRADAQGRCIDRKHALGRVRWPGHCCRTLRAANNNQQRSDQHAGPPDRILKGTSVARCNPRRHSTGLSGWRDIGQDIGQAFATLQGGA